MLYLYSSVSAVVIGAYLLQHRCHWILWLPSIIIGEDVSEHYSLRIIFSKTDLYLNTILSLQNYCGKIQKSKIVSLQTACHWNLNLQRPMTCSLKWHGVREQSINLIYRCKCCVFFLKTWKRQLEGCMLSKKDIGFILVPKF